MTELEEKALRCLRFVEEFLGNSRVDYARVPRKVHHMEVAMTYDKLWQYVRKVLAEITPQDYTPPEPPTEISTPEPTASSTDPWS